MEIVSFSDIELLSSCTCGTVPLGSRAVPPALALTLLSLSTFPCEMERTEVLTLMTRGKGLAQHPYTGGCSDGRFPCGCFQLANPHIGFAFGVLDIQQ